MSVGKKSWTFAEFSRKEPYVLLIFLSYHHLIQISLFYHLCKALAAYCKTSLEFPFTLPGTLEVVSTVVQDLTHWNLDPLSKECRFELKVLANC